ncbi:hypothetical protein L7F22_024801 [Adiantum nelumboides]|nr:hypothetical protein [Adiantum nelumboides]
MEQYFDEENFAEVVGQVCLTPDEGAPADVAVLLRPPQPAPHTHLIVTAPSSLLSRVPYFAAALREPWSVPSPTSMMRCLTLDCTPGTSTHTYFRCLHLLTATPPISPSVFDTVGEVLEFLAVANHLVFGECVEACMEFLGSVSWSLQEEDAIRHTLDALSMIPPDTVRERLSTSMDTASLESMFRYLLDRQALESMFTESAQRCLQSKSKSVKKVSNSILMKLRAMYSMESYKDGAMPRQWFTLTKALLQFTDASEIVLEFVKSQPLSESLNNHLADNHKDSACILTQVFDRVQKGTVCLSIPQRAELVKQYGKLSQWIKDADFNSALGGLLDTLPLNHPTLLHLVKSRPEMGLATMWFDRILHRIDGLKTHEVQALTSYIRRTEMLE